MDFPEVELDDNPVLNLLRVNKWIRDNISQLSLLTKSPNQWAELIEDGSGVTVPLNVVVKLCQKNKLTTVTIKEKEWK